MIFWSFYCTLPPMPDPPQVFRAFSRMGRESFLRNYRSRFDALPKGRGYI
jgi:hypothetical protein